MRLVHAWSRLAEGGTAHLVGMSSGEDAVFPAGALFGFGSPRTISTFGDLTSAVHEELTELLRLVAANRLSAEVTRRADWTEVGEAARALRDREVQGKIVLDVS